MPDYNFELQFRPDEIETLAAQYKYKPDDDCRAAGESARARGHYTRRELILVCGWKTPRSRGLVEWNRSGPVNARTGAAFVADDERTRMKELSALDGVAVRTPSALLHFAFPDSHPIIDVRALKSLGVDTKSYPIRLWLAYMAVCRDLAAQHGVSIRTLDKALWQYSKSLDEEAR